MNGMVAPVHEATVSSELRHLLVALRRGDGPQQDADVVPQAAEHRQQEGGDAPWIELSLRRDGKRPLKLRGLLIHRTEVRAPDGSRQLQLFAAEGGGAVAQFAYQPADGVAARPVFRVEPVRDTDELRLFIDSEAAEVRVSTAGKDLSRTGTLVPRAPRGLPFNPPGLARPDDFRPLDCEGNHS
jgi:hypothetical protein